ncbi:phage gp6-like head-tail connector protein [Leuconostoc lactis]|uniref:phage gp6-like head-tail connector protein n=1 Tax=Leuconostoc lactis TaxID=1246 RepID=UPI0024ADF0A4|nr:phage gp6-like head-tail connector protein [Leuconostoc lactis]MDI6496856.1 phage gp6-like head-tail connector protein [Leuconostoc lactis]
MALVTAQNLLDELHLDKSELSTIQNLINFAQDYITSTTAKNATVADVVAKTNENIFNQTVRSIVSSLYFGQAEQSGFGIQSMVLLNSIRNMYAGA